MTVFLRDLERFQELGLGLATKASPSQVSGEAAGLRLPSNGVRLKVSDSGSQVKVNSESDRIASDKFGALSNRLEVNVRVRFCWSRTTEVDYISMMVGLGSGLSSYRGKGPFGESVQSRES